MVAQPRLMKRYARADQASTCGFAGQLAAKRSSHTPQQPDGAVALAVPDRTCASTQLQTLKGRGLGLWRFGF
jgi:hypothetical protein